MGAVNVDISNNDSADDQKTHEEKMIAAAEEGVTSIAVTQKNEDGSKETTAIPVTNVPESTDGERPEGIPEKFWDAEKKAVNVEALLKSQQDAEATIHGKDQATDETKDEESNEEAPADQPQVVTDASAEFAEKGELSEETYSALDKAGLPRSMVDEYIAGQTAIATQIQGAAYGEFEGGAESYNEATQWASQNMTDEEIKGLDVQLTSMNPAIVQAGAAALRKAYDAGRDIDPDVTLQGGGNTNATTGGYTSGAQMRTDMADPRYKTDPAFRAEVSSKIAKSKADLFG